MLKWKNDYLIGVPEIDAQHQKLFEIAGRAYELLRKDFYTDKYDKIVEIIEELKDYAVYHFRFEEQYMLSINYRRFLSQKAEHEEFIQKLENTDLSKIDNDQDAYLMSILEFIVSWTAEHIIEKDKLITASK
jgi:hemerythrin